MTRYELTKAEEGTPTVDALLAAGWEPFAVVSEPVQIGRYLAGERETAEWVPVYAYVNVIWFRRVLA